MQRAFKGVAILALPIMLSYVAIGLPCGVLEAQCGLTPWMAFLLSITLYSGAGQFMMCNLWIAGTPLATIAVSVGAVSLRQALYSASLAPYLERSHGSAKLAALLTVTDESYGANLSQFQDDERWTAAHSLALNIMCMLSWACANAVGVVIGAAVDIPTAIASFAMTSLFICLWLTQPATRANILAAAGAIAGVIAFKALGLTSVAVPCGAVVGVVLACALGRSRGSSPNGGAGMDA